MLGARRRRAGFHVRATRPQQRGGGPAATATTTVPTPPATPIRRVRRGQHPASVGSADGANATPSTYPCASSRLARRRRPHPGRDLQGRGTPWFPERQRGPGQPPVSEVDRAAGPGSAGEVEVVALPGDRGSRAQVVADDADDGVAELSKAAEGGTSVLAEVFALGRSVAGIGVVGQAQERAQYVDAGLAEVAGAGVVGEPGQGVDAAELDCGGEVAELGDGAVNRSVRCPCSVSSCVRRCPSYAASTPSMAAWAERRIALPVHRMPVRGRPAAWHLGGWTVHQLRHSALQDPTATARHRPGQVLSPAHGQPRCLRPARASACVTTTADPAIRPPETATVNARVGGDKCPGQRVLRCWSVSVRW